MGFIIDIYYLIRELMKLTFMVAISPLGILAAYLLGVGGSANN